MECYFCGEPLTSDDYKQDRVLISRTGNERHCHIDCYDKNLGELTTIFESEEN